MQEEFERNIIVSSAPKLNSFDLARVNSALNASFDKIQRVVDGEMRLLVHFKESRASGRRELYTVQLKLVFPRKTVVAQEENWSPVVAVQNALHSLERETIEAVKRMQEKR
ncbi:MAG: hypothetical protein JW744_02935 [Candidatus Diapherotrites archaeon]|uniref:HPF/RaiA family ribosome-associated protein n=1 Tax=Candidatus Iainarchaeum sp. TaxID=3101447 RepID=A0A939C6F8_9ARCH|nr:hypothetical protein [Candidatus Diapherotrites archaeon]